MMEKSDKLCQDIMKIVDSLMPGKIFFHPSNDLVKIIEHIFGRATNEPQSCRQYAKLCQDIVYELRLQASRAKFKTTLVSMVQQRFAQILGAKKDSMPLNVRLGIVRFIGELYNFTFLTEKIVSEVMKKIRNASTPLQFEHCQYLHELIKVAGWKLDEADPEILMAFKKSLRSLPSDQANLSVESRQMILKIYNMQKKDFVNPKDEFSPDKKAIDISKLSLKPTRKAQASESESSQNPDLVLAIESFLRAPSKERLDRIVQDIKLLEFKLAVSIIHQMATDDNKLSNAIAILCKIIDSRGALPKFQEAMLEIIRSNLQKSVKYSSIFNEADCDYAVYKHGDYAVKPKIKTDIMPLVTKTAKDLLSSFVFLGHLYNNEFVSGAEVMQFLESLSSVRIVSNLSIECFEAIFALTAPKLVMDNKGCVPVLIRYFNEILTASKICPRTPKTEHLVNSLVSKAQTYLGHSFADMFMIDDYDFEFPDFESEFETQRKMAPF